MVLLMLTCRLAQTRMEGAALFPTHSNATHRTQNWSYRSVQAVTRTFLLLRTRLSSPASVFCPPSPDPSTVHSSLLLRRNPNSPSQLLSPELSAAYRSMVEADGLPRRPFYRRRPCACCCLIFFSILLVVAIIIVILAFTLFKPKDAEVNVEKVDLLGLSADLGTFSGIIPIPAVNVTLGVLVSVHNPNRASLKYANSSAMVYYHDDEVAVAPIPAGSIGSQGTENISTVLVVLADQLVTNSHLVGDVVSGSLPFTTRTKISGRVKVIFIKHHVDITSQCSVSVSIASRSLTDNGCDNDVNL